MADQKKTETISTTNDFAIIVYPWKSAYLDSSMEEGKPFLLDLGVHYVSFSRNKNIGGSMQIDCYGAGMEAEIGDWVVFKTSSKKNISNKLEDALKEGVTRFIGQIYTRNTSHVADAEGNVRTHTQYSIREWSHVFHIQVKLDQVALANNSNETARTKILADTAGQLDSTKFEGKNSTDLFNEFIKKRFNPFDYSIALLKLVGGLSANDDRVTQQQFSNLFQVSTRLPIVPEKLVEHNVQTYVAPGKKDPEKFDKTQPWSTGFFWSILGVQEWSKAGEEYSEVLKDASTLWENLKLLTNTRPLSLNSPIEYAMGFSFIDSLQSQFDSAGVYEMYTDLLYFSESNKCAPALIVRDKPMSFEKLLSGKTDKHDVFGWTTLDGIPRTTIRPASVLSISFSGSASESINHVRLGFDPGYYRAESEKNFSTQNGVYTQVPSQKKFGSVVAEFVIKAFMDPEQLPGSQKNKSAKSEASPQTVSKTQNWFKALSQRIGNYLPYKFMFPSASLYIKDNDYPITVGMAVRIPFKSKTVVGFVESINYIYKIEETGKRRNDIYINLSDCCTEDEKKKLQPLPREFIASLPKYVSDAEDTHQTEVLSKWVFLSPSDK